MDTFSFKAIGTQWNVSVDGGYLTEECKRVILSRIEKFESQFSRFLPSSEVNSFRESVAGTYPISKEFYVLLRRADYLRDVTNGIFDPAVGELLERAGYNQSFSFQESEDINEFKIPQWSLVSDSLRIGGPISFDLGGIGKGYAIDFVSHILTDSHYKHYMVEAGGDMYGTTKADGSHWNIAIEYPGQPDKAVGSTTLSHEAIAVSDTFRRRWGKWNHIMNPQQKKSIEGVVGATAVADTAWDADCMTSVLFLGREHAYATAAKEFSASYLVFYQGGACLKSNNWVGEVFE